MTHIIDQLAPYPAREEDVTADGLARNAAARAQYRLGLMWKPGNEPLFDGLHCHAYNAEYALCSLLRAFAAVDPDRADLAARAIWRALDDGAMTGEHLWEWLTEYGIDPDRINPEAEPVGRITVNGDGS